MDGIRELIRGHTTPEQSPTGANQTPPEPAPRTLSPRDIVDLSSRERARGRGGLTVNGSGLYSLQASSLSLSAQSLNITMGSRSGGGGAGAGALGVLNEALGATGAGGSGPMSRLRSALQELGLSDENIRDLMMLAALLEKIDPEALERFVEGMESFTGKVAAPAVDPAALEGAAAPAAAGGTASAGHFSLNYVSVSISITEVQARAVQAEGGEVHQVSARHFEVRFERLEVSMSGAMLEGDPVVLDVAGDGLDLRETGEGVLFDLTGSGEAVRTAFVEGDDALLFYDQNMNGLLDGGAELVGNRVEGLNGFEELAEMDENGDGAVNGLDSAWPFLKLFQDLDGDGRVGAPEVALLQDLGITELAALWERDDADDGEGLRRVGRSAFTREDGSQGLMLDYYFGYRPA
jgi:hypothetical protein